MKEFPATKRSPSISARIAEQIETEAYAEGEYERASASAIARMKRGLHLGGHPMVSRDELHER